jgi:hypothetical protein
LRAKTVLTLMAGPGVQCRQISVNPLMVVVSVLLLFYFHSVSGMICRTGSEGWV